MPLLWLSLAFLCGILLASSLSLPLAVWLVLAGISLIAGFAWRWLPARFPALSRLTQPVYSLQQRLPAVPQTYLPIIPIPILFIALFLGAARYQASIPEITPAHIAWYKDRDAPAIVEGVLIVMPDERDAYTNLRLQVERLQLEGDSESITIEGDMLARAPPLADIRYGDRLQLRGYLRSPPEDETFSYRQYLARHGIYAYLSCPTYLSQDCVQVLAHDQGNALMAWIYALRQRALQTAYRIFPDPEASLLAGILLGIETGIPEDVQRAFRDTGTSHIIAISGFNFAIVAGLFAVLFNRLLGRWRGMLAAFLGIGLYAVLAGASAPVIRAAIMGTFSVFAVQIGRRQHGINTLLFVAALMSLHDPHVLWDVGFQLSFMATLGLVLYAEPLTQAFSGVASRFIPQETANRLARPVGEYLLFTLAATLTTLPVILYHFQRVSLISILANPLILPAQPAVMVLGGLATILGMIIYPLGQTIAYLTWPFLVYTIRVVELLARVQPAAISLGQVNLVWVLVFYSLLFSWPLWGKRLLAKDAQDYNSLRAAAATGGLLSLGLLAVLSWQLALSLPDGRLHLTVLDVGSGDAILIQTPTGRNLLIDGGTSPNMLSDALGRRLPITARRLDYLVVAGTNDEQIAALSRTLERFPPVQALWSGTTAGTYNTRQLRRSLAQAGTPVLFAQGGQSLDLGNGATLQALAVSRRGAVLLVEWGGFRALLPVGLDFDSQEALMVDYHQGTVTALLLAESGFAPLNPPEWIDRWHPQVILLSVAAGDVEGRPDEETLDAVSGYTLLRTDLNGWISLSTDGEQMWVEVERR